MIGTSSQEDKQMLRQAQIAKYLNLLYEDAFQDWQKKRHDQLLDIARHALALQKFRLERMPPGATTLETFADFRDWKASHLTEATEYLAAFDEGDVLRFLKEPKTSREVRNLAFAYFTPEEFPTHRMLQELMMLDPVGSEREQIIEIATLILPWCRDGSIRHPGHIGVEASVPDCPLLHDVLPEELFWQQAQQIGFDMPPG
jgi:hypothetical protein